MEHTPNDCTPLKRNLAYLRRQTPWLLAIGLLIFFVPAQHLFTYMMEQLHGAAPIVPGGPDLDGAQVEAANQSRWVPLGIIISKLGAAVFFYFIAIGLIWWTMHRITPALPLWAKRDFTTSFKTLPVQWQYATYISCWLGLLFFFARCLEAASLVQ
jgi:hypothetical protein